MADGLMTIAALVREGRPTSVRQLRPNVLLEDELPAYDVLINYYREHGSVPPPEVFERADIRLPDAPSEFSYYLGELNRRAVHNAARNIHTDLTHALNQRDTEGTIELARRFATAMGALRAEQTIKTIGQESSIVVEDYLTAHENPGLRGVPLGWEPLDEITAGALPGDLVVLVARPNIGKTYALLRMALQAWAEGYVILFVTMEMTGVQVTRRLLGMQTGINPDRIRRGMLSDRAYARMRDTVQVFQSSNNSSFYVLPGDFSKTTADVGDLAREFDPDIIYIDASYLMRPQEAKRARWEAQAQIHEELKGIALSRNLPIVCTVQANRDTKKRGKPEVENIAGSDAIGQVASIVVSLREGEGINRSIQRRFDVVKNRDGPLGSFVTKFAFDPIDFGVESVNIDVQESEDGDPTVDNAANRRHRQQQMNRTLNRDRI